MTASCLADAVEHLGLDLLGGVLFRWHGTDPPPPGGATGAHNCASVGKRLPGQTCRPVGSLHDGVHRPAGGGQPGPVGGHGRSPLCARPGRRHPPGQCPAGLGAAGPDLRGPGAASGGHARAHDLPSRLDGLLADLDHNLVREAEAFTQTAAEHGVAPEVEPWPVCLGYTCYLRCTAHDGALEGLTALYAAERAYLDTWTAVAGRSPPTRPTMPGSRTGAGRRSAPLSAPSAGAWTSSPGRHRRS